jgi:hypothetical protein
MSENISGKDDKLQKTETKIDKTLKAIQEIERLLKPLEEVMVKVVIFLLTIIGLYTILTGKLSL